MTEAGGVAAASSGNGRVSGATGSGPRIRPAARSKYRPSSSIAWPQPSPWLGTRACRIASVTGGADGGEQGSANRVIGERVVQHGFGGAGPRLDRAGAVACCPLTPAPLPRVRGRGEQRPDGWFCAVWLLRHLTPAPLPRVQGR